ncbi:MAG: hypothetical protein AAFV53_08845 [Myxococcota bacterium]
MIELVERGGAMSGLALLTIALVWSGSVFRLMVAERDYRAASAGGWLMMGGVALITLATATLVPPHTSVLMTVYAGLGPPLLAVLGMGGLVLLDGVAAARNRSTPLRMPVVRWGGMALILSGLGLLMELRSALTVHMEMPMRASPEELVAGVERWYALARGAGGVAGLLGLGLWLDGHTAPWLSDDEDRG